MALSEDLKELWDSLSCSTYRGDQHTHILIKENARQAKLRHVTIIAPNGDWFSFDPDKGRGPKAIMSPLLTVGNAHDHHRACDCVILVKRGENLTVIYIDLKSGNPKGYAGQFKSTRQFMRYSLGLLSEFQSKNLNVTEERYVILYGGKPTSINKRPTVPQTRKIGKTEPGSPHKREVSNPCTLYLKELLA